MDFILHSSLLGFLHTAGWYVLILSNHVKVLSCATVHDCFFHSCALLFSDFINPFVSFRVWKHWNPSCDSFQLRCEPLCTTCAILEQHPNPNHTPRQSHTSTALPSTRFSFLKDLILCTEKILRKYVVGQLKNWVSQRNRELPMSSIYIQWSHLLRVLSLQQLERFLSCHQINQHKPEKKWTTKWVSRTNSSIYLILI